MPLPRPRLARPLFALFALVLAVGSCGRDLLGPGGTRRAVVALNPEFGAMRLDGAGQPLSISSIVTFTRVRVVLLRANGDTAVDRMVDFPADADSVALAFTVTLSPTAPAEGESLGAAMRFLTAAGDTVFAAGPVSVQARPTSTTTPPAPVTIPVTYVGPGKDAASLTITPDSVVGIRGQSVTLTAAVRDAQGAVLPNTPVAYTSSDTTLVRVTLGGGVATLVGARGTALVIAQTLTGQRDTARVSITPTASAIAIATGNNQEVRQGGTFAQPLVARVTAVDGLPIADVPVRFAVATGRGSVGTALDTTDAQGLAQTTWTAGDTAMTGSVVAAVDGQSTVSVTFAGTQLSTGPSFLAFAVPPRRGVPAGDSIGPVVVGIYNRFNELLPNYRGTMTLALTGGPAGAQLRGATTVPVDSGSSAGWFSDVTIDKGGSGYRLVATLLSPNITATSDTFSLAPPRPATLELLTGDGRVTPGGSVFPDSIRVWVKDRFGVGIGGVPVTFTIIAGSGSVSPTPLATNASGIAAAAWTAGLSGPQVVDVSVPGLSPVRVTGRVPSAIVLTSGAGQSARFGEAFAQPVIFTVLGDSGQVLPSAPVVFTATGGGSLTAPQFADAQGLIRVTWTAGNLAGPATLTARIPGTDLTATAVNTQASPGPTSVAFSTEPVTIAAGDTLPTIRVRVMDGLATTIPTFTGRVVLTLEGGAVGATLAGPALSANAVAGIATFSGLTVTRAGSGVQLRASVENTALTTLSTTFSVTPAAPATITLLSGANQTAPGGSVLPTPITVEVRDVFGFGVPGVSVAFGVSSGGGTVAPTTTVTDSLGRASTTWTVGSSGAQRLSVAAGGLPPLTVAATIPQALTLVGGGGQSALFGSPFTTPISFRVLGDSARPLAGIPVDFSVSGGGLLSQASDTSDANGLVSVTWTAGTLPGMVTLTASVSGMPLYAGASGQQASPAPSLLTLTGAPTQLVAGDSMPVVQVQVLNGLGQTATTYTGGVRLTLGGGTAGAQLLGTTVRQATSGVATFTGLSIDRAGNGYRLFAELDPYTPGLQTNSDTITVTPAPATGIVLVSGGGQTAPEFVPLADSIVVRVVDRFGFGVPGVTVQFAVLSGGGSIPTPSAVTSGGVTPGRAAVRWTVGPVGAQQLKVGAAGLADLIVTATSVPAGGPPVLFIGQGDGLSLRVGQPQPVTLFLSSPSPSPITVNLSTSTSGVATWEVPSFSIPAGQTQFVTELLPVGVGQTVASISSSAGNDSIFVTVDSAAVGLRVTSVSTSVGDTVRTQVVLDAPAPIGGVTATVTSLDPTKLLVAAGSGRGLAEPPECISCYALRAADDTSATVLGPPGASATIQIAAGQIAGEVILLPIAAPEAGQQVDVTIAAPGRFGAMVPVFLDPAALSAFVWTGTAPIGHRLSGEVQLFTPVRRPVTVTVRSLDPGIVVPVDSVLLIEALELGAGGVSLGTTIGVGLGRLVVEAAGFAPDTIPVEVVERRLVLEEDGNTNLQVGQGYLATARLGTQPTAFTGFISDAPTAAPVPVTFTSLDSTIVAVVQPSVLADGVAFVEARFRGAGVGTTSVIASAPGYGADTLTFVVGSPTPTLTLDGPLTSGFVASLSLDWGAFGVPLRSPTDFSVTVADTAVLGVLTPTVRIPAGGLNTTVRLEARTAGTTTVTITAPGLAPVTQSVTVVAPTTVAAVFAPDTVDVSQALQTLSIYLDGEAADRQVFRLRSSDPAVAAVVDSILVIPAGGSFGSAAFRALAVGQARFILSTVAGVDVDTSAFTLVNAPLLGASGPGLLANRMPIGRGTRVELRAFVLGQVASGLTVTRSGPLGTSIIGPDSLALDEYGDQPIIVVGPSTLPTTGADTITISRAGSNPLTIVVEAATIVPTPLIGSVALGQAAEVGASFALAGPSTLTEYGVQLTDPRAFRLVSLDTTRLRVEQDTVRLGAPGVPGRLGQVRALGTGMAALVLQPFSATPDVGLDTVLVFIERARLYSPFYSGEALQLGMQQRTFAQEVYVERNAPSRKPLWVRLRSSVPTIASVPDSVLIPADSIYAYVPVTGGDTVGTVRITASATQHIDVGFDVRVQRTRLAPHTPLTESEVITTGGRTTVDVYVLAPDGGYGGGQYTLQAVDGPTTDLQSPVGGTVRPNTVPIPIRVVSADTAILAAVRDTATIPANAFVVRLPGVVGRVPGRVAARIEDRRATAFARLTPSEGSVLVEQATLAILPEAPLNVPYLGLTAPSRRPSIVSSASSDSVVVQFTSRQNRFAVEAPTLPLVGTDSVLGGPFTPVLFPLRGLALGRDTLIATAPGHRPDTLIVEVTGGAIDLVETTPIPATLRVGDSLFVALGIRDATGSAVEVTTPITLTLTTTPTLATSTGPAPLPLVDIDGGEAFTCGRRPDGKVYCWGQNAFAQLGIGSTTDALSPALVGNGMTFTSLTVGGRHACGLATDGKAYCWGDNFYGQLGNGTNIASSVPTVVEPGFERNWASLSAGGLFTCGTTTTGEVFCWGRNNAGQLGNGVLTDFSVPVLTSQGTRRFSSVSAGNDHTCAIDDTNGTVHCWGNNQSGKLGDGTTINRSVPTAVSGSGVYTAISAGGGHTCGILSSGGATCWGENINGSIGSGSFSSSLPIPTAVAGGLTWTSVAAGGTHTCAVSSGNLFCWGNNSNGQVGDSTLINRRTPVLVGGNGDVLRAAAGGSHSCGIGSNNEAACWGTNQHGQIGDGTLITRTTPTFLNLLGGGSTASVTLQPGMTAVGVWLTGVSAGTATLTATTPNFTTFHAALTVRTP